MQATDCAEGLLLMFSSTFAQVRVACCTEVKLYAQRFCCSVANVPVWITNSKLICIVKVTNLFLAYS